MTKVGNPDWHSDVSLTTTSEYYQDGGRGSRGRITIANARMNEEGWNTADFSKSPAATKILEEHPKLREQIKACTASRCMIADINHGQYKELRELIVKVLTLENKRENVTICCNLSERWSTQINTKICNCLRFMMRLINYCGDKSDKSSFFFPV